MTSDDELPVFISILELILEPYKLVSTFIKLIGGVVVLNIVHCIENKDRNVLAHVSSVVASIHHSCFYISVFNQFTVAGLIVEPQVVDVGIIDWFLTLLSG